MKLITTISIITLFTTFAQASEKASITLNKDSMSSFGGSGSGEEPMRVKISRGLFDDEPITNADKIAAMKMEIAKIEFLETKKVNLSKVINANYKDIKLSTVLKELIPGVEVNFKGVDAGVMVKSFEIKEASLEQVLRNLDRSAGVSLSYSKKGVMVVAVKK